MDLQAVAGNVVLGSRKQSPFVSVKPSMRAESPCTACTYPLVETPGEISSQRARLADAGHAWIQEERGGAHGVEMPLAVGVGVQGTPHTCVIISHFRLRRSFRCCQLEAWGQLVLLAFT